MQWRKYQRTRGKPENGHMYMAFENGRCAFHVPTISEEFIGKGELRYCVLHNGRMNGYFYTLPEAKRAAVSLFGSY